MDEFAKKVTEATQDEAGRVFGRKSSFGVGAVFSIVLAFIIGIWIGLQF